MTTRRKPEVDPNAPDITNTAAEDMPAVPAGVAADVTVRYKTSVREKARAADFDPELDRLAALTAGDDNPPDPLSEFLESYANYVGYNCMVLRLPDPSTRRMQGQTYNRPHFGQPEQLGAITFDPNPINFISSLQIVNGGSGGCFQIWLTSHNGERIADAVLYSVAIADPPRQPVNTNATQLQPTPAPPLRQSDSERQLEQVKNELFSTALQRALNPTAPAPGGNGLSAEDNAALFLLGKTDFLGSIFGKFAELAHNAGAQAVTEPSWRDRAIDAGVDIVKTNPQIVERLSGVVERIIARVLPDPRFDGPPLPQQPYYQQQQPWQQPPAAPAPQSAPSPAPAPATASDLSEALDLDDDMDEDDEIMDTLDRLIVLINSNEPLSLEHPVVLQLLRDYPLKARMALRLIAAQPLDDIIEWIKATGGPLYESMLTGPASGPFLRQRLGEFKQVCDDASAKVKAAQAPPAPADPATTPETETARDSSS